MFRFYRFLPYNKVLIYNLIFFFMKRLLQLVSVFALMLSFACEGPEGPPGPQGETGPAGTRGPAGEDAQRSAVLDSYIDFEADEEGGNYSSGFSLASLEVSDSDIVLVYMLAGVIPDGNGNNMVFWSPLPQTYRLEQGPVTYTYAYADAGVLLFIDTEINWAELTQEEREDLTLEQVFRFVVIPGETYAANQRTKGSLEYLQSLSYHEILKKFNISDKKVPVLN